MAAIEAVVASRTLGQTQPIIVRGRGTSPECQEGEELGGCVRRTCVKTEYGAIGSRWEPRWRRWRIAAADTGSHEDAIDLSPGPTTSLWVVQRTPGDCLDVAEAMAERWQSDGRPMAELLYAY